MSTYETNFRSCRGVCARPRLLARRDLPDVFTHVPVDSSTAPLHQLLGSLTSDVNGAFELTNVPRTPSTQQLYG